MAEAGKGTLEITRTLNTEGIASPKGKLWGKTSIHGILTNEAYTGTLLWGVKAKDKGEPVRVEKAFPAIVSKAQFRRVNQQLRSRAPKVTNPRRVGSSYLLSGLIKCQACNTSLNGRFAQSGKYAYYVCPSNIKLGRDACETPSINARRFEELVVNKIRLQHPHRWQHPRPGEGGGRGDGRPGPGAAQAAGDHRRGAGGGEAEAGPHLALHRE